MERFGPREVVPRPVTIGLGLLESGASRGQRGARLRELCAERRAIETSQHLGGFHARVEIDLDRGDPPRDLGAHLHGRHRFDPSRGAHFADEVPCETPCSRNRAAIGTGCGRNATAAEIRMIATPASSIHPVACRRRRRWRSRSMSDASGGL
jgi:hypothetical protein